MRTQVFITIALLLSWFGVSNAQTFEVRVTESGLATGLDTLTFEIQYTGGTSFVLGTSTFVVDYNTSALAAPVKLVNLDGPWDSGLDPDYQDVARVRDTTTGFAGITVEFVGTSAGGGDDDNGAIVPNTFTRIGALRFPVKNSTLQSNLAWRAIGSVTQVFKLTTPGDPSDLQTNITLDGIFVPPLPIELSSLTATVVNQNSVRLDWTTATETNNYGFEVQKSAGNQNSYQTISNSFIAGHGTTIEPHSYSFVDNTASPGQWYYRLKQIDFDGTVHFSDGVQVDVVTGVTEKPLPKVFALDQNYPNPFNPSTKIEYAVPKSSHVLLEVYNVIGQKVATLVDEAKSAGYYSTSFDASRFASGLYFYSMKAGEVSFLKKMMLVK